MFFKTPFFIPLLFPKLIWKIPTEEKKIFLTFDDGPVPGPTEFVLNQLKSFNAKATFFCIGNNVTKHPQIFNRLIEDGHAIGNHTYNHVKGWGTSTKQYVSEVNDCNEVIGYTGLFRPPYGRITPAQIRELKNHAIVMWDVLSHDYSSSMNPERCLKGVINATRPGSIIVFHDSYKAERNMNYVLPRLLDHFSDKNFTFQSLSRNK